MIASAASRWVKASSLSPLTMHHDRSGKPVPNSLHQEQEGMKSVHVSLFVDAVSTRGSLGCRQGSLRLVVTDGLL